MNQTGINSFRTRKSWRRLYSTMCGSPRFYLNTFYVNYRFDFADRTHEKCFSVANCIVLCLSKDNFQSCQRLITNNFYSGKRFWKVKNKQGANKAIGNWAYNVSCHVGIVINCNKVKICFSIYLFLEKILCNKGRQKQILGKRNFCP